MSQTEDDTRDSMSVETAAISNLVETEQAPAPVLTYWNDGRDLSRDSWMMRISSVIFIAIIACAAVWHGWKRDQVLAPVDGL